jgi:hypothetical protein
MVFFYTNFAAETNVWWLRRVRPVWMTTLAIGASFFWYRYYFYGKIQARLHENTPVEEHIRVAELNKRNWGHTRRYNPTNPDSIKHKLY